MSTPSRKPLDEQTSTAREPVALRRNSGIDCLRGASILLVVLHHIALRIPLQQTALADVVPMRVLVALSDNGYEAVFVFFVISGFLIANRSLQRWGELRAIDARSFHRLRAARIVPCLVLLVVVLSVMHALGVPYYVIDKPTQSWSGAVMSALGLYLNWYEGQTGWLPGGWDVLWSLSIEEVFYLAFPIVCMLVRDVRVLVFGLSVLALSLPFTRAALAGNEIWQEKAYLPGIAAIATGVLTALAAHRFAWRVVVARTLIALGAVGLLCVLLFDGLIYRAIRDGSLLVLTVSAASLVLGLHALPPRAATRGLGWLRSFGRLSYEIYLSHMFVVFATIGLFKRCGGNVRSGFWWFIPAVLLCWFLGAMIARWYSEPCYFTLLAGRPRHGS